MRKRLFGYNDFLLESKIEMLLEAKIRFNDDFVNVLDKMDNVTADKLLNMIGKDVDVNTNYIDINIDKDGFVNFIPDDKAEKLPLVVVDDLMTYSSTSDKMNRFGKYKMENISRPHVGQEVKIVKEFTNIHEFFSLYPEDERTDIFLAAIGNIYDNNGPMLHISFEDSNGTHNVLCNPNALKRDISSIKSSQLKIGKFVTAMFTKGGIDFKPTDIEDFVNKYKSVITQMRDKFNNFKIVKGKDIRNSYLVDNYLNTNGSLGNSCMRYDKCQKFLDIYVENPDKVSLVILEKEGKITGRAILWTDDKDRKVMDRIYTNNSADEQLFKDFAKANNFWYKKDQNMYEDTPFIGPNGEEERNITIQLDEVDHNYYPYMDSMKFYNPNTGILTNNGSSGYEYNLTDTDGGNGSCDECGGSGRLECGDCDGDGEVECRECGGDGEVNCEECDGDGEVECSVCDGEGKEECGYCDGHGESECSACDGEGKIEGDDGEEEECSDCGGSGKESCEHCDGEGSRECGPCDGSGNRKCRYCDGGQVECGECEGGGNVTCRNCDGDGRVDCWQCG
jgi:hypothetical protein